MERVTFTRTAELVRVIQLDTLLTPAETDLLCRVGAHQTCLEYDSGDQLGESPGETLMEETH